MTQISYHVSLPRCFLIEVEIFKDLIPSKANMEKAWSKTEIHLTNGSKVYVKAYTPSIRGLHVDYVLCDEAGEYEDFDIFYSVISPTVVAKKGIIVVIGTPTSEVDLLSQLEDKKAYFCKSYKMRDPEGNYLWPDKFGKDVEKEVIDSQGDASFEKEYLLNPRAQADSALYPPMVVSECFDRGQSFKLAAEGETFL